MQAVTTVLALLALAHTALAGVYITQPVGTTQAVGGQVLNVAWADDGKTPTVAQVGQCSIDLYTGSVNQQTWLQNIAASVDVSKASAVSTTINPAVGQSGNYYFVRFTSLAFKDPNNPQYPYEAFSAKFSISQMSGTWNSTVLAQIDAGSSAASSGSAPTAAAAASSASAKVSGAASASGAAAAASTSKSAGELTVAAPGLLLGLVGLAGYYAL